MDTPASASLRMAPIRAAGRAWSKFSRWARLLPPARPLWHGHGIDHGFKFPKAKLGQAIILICDDSWPAARQPRSAYREMAPLSMHGFFFGGGGMGGIGGLGVGNAWNSMLFATSGKGTSHFIQGAMHPIDQLGLCKLAGWEIATDEALDSSHPMLAMAFIKRAELAESSGDSKAIWAFGQSLGRAMAGLSAPDGLGAQWALGIEKSMWARSRAEKIMEIAATIARSLIDSREISKAIQGQALALAGTDRANRL